MVTKSQKKTRRRAKLKRREKLLQLKTSSAMRFKARLSKQMPFGWEGDLPEDVAIFDSTARGNLSADAQQHVDLVRTALGAVCKRGGSDALETLREIPRRSPFSEWRVFLRGLVD